MDWTIGGLLVLKTERSDGRRLIVTVQVDTLVAVALETGDLEEASSDEARVAGVLSDHAHQLLGKGTSLQDAIEISENYAHRWLKRAVEAPPCDCPNVPATLDP